MMTMLPRSLPAPAMMLQVDMEMEQRALERGFDSDQEREEQVRPRCAAGGVGCRGHKTPTPVVLCPTAVCMW